MTPRNDQHLSPDAAEGVTSATKHGFMYTLRKSLSSISLSSRRSAETVGSNTRDLRKQPQGTSNIYDDTFDISQMPKDVFAYALRDALTSPGQDFTGPYLNSGIKRVHYSHSMCDFSGHMTRTAEATDPPDQPPPHQSHEVEVADVASPKQEPVQEPVQGPVQEPIQELVASPSARKLHCREARIPLSASTANIRAVSYGDFDEPPEARHHRISTSYDWLFNSALGPPNTRAEALDLIGPDPFRWVPTRAQVSEQQKSLQVPESTASGALRLTTSASHGQLSSNLKVNHYKSHHKRRQEDVWWV